MACLSPQHPEAYGSFGVFACTHVHVHQPCAVLSGQMLLSVQHLLQPFVSLHIRFVRTNHSTCITDINATVCRGEGIWRLGNGWAAAGLAINVACSAFSGHSFCIHIGRAIPSELVAYSDCCDLASPHGRGTNKVNRTQNHYKLSSVRVVKVKVKQKKAWPSERKELDNQPAEEANAGGSMKFPMKRRSRQLHCVHSGSQPACKRCR